MPEEDNAALVAQFLDELWNKRNLAIIDQLTVEDYVVNVAQGSLLGREALKIVAKFYFERFSLIHVSILDQTSQDSQVVTRIEWDTALELRDQSLNQEIEREIPARGVSIDRIDNGQIAESWNMLDTLYWISNVGWVAGDPGFVRIVPAIKTCDPNPPHVDPPQCGIGQCCTSTGPHTGYCLPPQRCPHQ